MSEHEQFIFDNRKRPEQMIHKERTTILMTPNQKAVIRGECEETGLCMSEVVRQALRKWFRTRGKNFPVA